MSQNSKSTTSPKKTNYQEQPLKSFNDFLDHLPFSGDIQVISLLQIKSHTCVIGHSLN
jgi:hypothetical protein